MKRLVIENSWENYFYKVDGTKIDPNTIKEVYDKDGNSYKVRHKKETVSYNDTGHTYYATRTLLIIDHPLGEIIIKPHSEVYVKDL